MLPMGSIFFPLIEALLRCDSLYVETNPTVRKLVFDDTDTNILRACVHVLLIV